jgi:hypothetical protein
MDTGDKSKLSEIHAQSRVSGLMMEQAARKIAGGEAIWFGDFTDVIDSCDASSTAHILNDDCRLSRDMSAQVLGEDPAFDIGGTAGGEVDHERQSLSSIIRRLFRCESLRPS